MYYLAGVGWGGRREKQHAQEAAGPERLAAAVQAVGSTAEEEQAEPRVALSCSLTCTSTGTSSAAACSSATRSSGAQAEARTTEPRRQGGQEDEADAGCPHEEGAERGASLACLPACPVPTHGTAASSPQVPRAQKKQTEQRLAAEAARGAEVKAWVKAKLRKRKHALPEVIFFTKHLGLQVGATAATVEWVVDFLLRDSSKLQGVHVLVLSEVEWSDRSKAALARFISACPVLCVLDARGSGCQALQNENIKDRENRIFIGSSHCRGRPANGQNVGSENPWELGDV